MIKSFQRNNNNQNQKPNPNVSNANTNVNNPALQQVSKQMKNVAQLMGSIRNTFLNNRVDGLRDAYASYQDNILADYIYGLYHPDVVFKENLDIKSPSYVPIPTTQFKFKENITLQPGNNGNLLIYWSPNYLATNSILAKKLESDGAVYANLYVNSSSHLNGNSAVELGWNAIPFHNVTQDFEKYRLTSACIKVKYIGKKIDQSGMLSAAATYVNAYRTSLMVPSLEVQTGLAKYSVPDTVAAKISQFGDFDNIRQGQWAETISLVNNPDGITCVYVPTDPLNQVFVDNCETIDNTQPDMIDTPEGRLVYWSPKNANISYVICAYGIDVSAPCISVETYYNYEIIVRQEQFPYFSPKAVNEGLLKHTNMLQSLSGLVTRSGLITTTREHDKPSIYNKVKAALHKAGGVFKDIYEVFGPLYKMLV